MHTTTAFDPAILSARYYRNGREAAQRDPRATEAALAAPLAALVGPHASTARDAFLAGVRSVRGAS